MGLWRTRYREQGEQVGVMASGVRYMRAYCDLMPILPAHPNGCRDHGWQGELERNGSTVVGGGDESAGFRALLLILGLASFGRALKGKPRSGKLGVDGGGGRLLSRSSPVSNEVGAD